MTVPTFHLINLKSEGSKEPRQTNRRIQWAMIAVLAVIASIALIAVRYQRIHSDDSPAAVIPAGN